MHKIIFLAIHTAQWALLPVTLPSYIPLRMYYCPGTIGSIKVVHKVCQPLRYIGCVALPYPLVCAATNGAVEDEQ